MPERRIFKYRLPPAGYAGLGAHGNPTWLAVGWQGHQLVLWAEVDESMPVKVHGFEVVMTGYQVPTDEHATAEYVGTAQLIEADGTPYVVHVYRWIPDA